MKNIKVKTILLTLPLLVTAFSGCASRPVQKDSSSPSSTSPSSVSNEASTDVSSVTPSRSSDISESGQSNTSKSSSASSSSAQGSSSSKPTGPAREAKITFWHTFGQGIVDNLKTKAAKFAALVKENDNVDVTIDLKYQGSYDDIAKIISDGYIVDNVPTISVAYPDNVADYIEIGKEAGSEFVVNLERFVDDPEIGFGKEAWLGDLYDEEDFVEDFYDEGSSYVVDGMYSLPFMKSTEIMYYNMDLLIEVMKTYKPELQSSQTMIQEYMKKLSWDEFMELCAYVKSHMSEISNMLEVPMWYDSDANFLISKMYQNKIPYSSISNEGKGRIDFRDGEAFNQVVDLLDDARLKFKNGLFTTKGIKDKYGSAAFTNEQCLFSIGSSGGSGYQFPEAEAFEIGVCRVPASNNNPLYVSQGPTLTLFNDKAISETENELRLTYAWKFLKYITNGQVNTELCINGSQGYVPVRYSAYETATFREFMEEGENYAKCYRVVVSDVNSDGGYLIAPSYKGSAALRDECGALFTASLNANSKDAIPGLVNTAINSASLKMGAAN